MKRLAPTIGFAAVVFIAIAFRFFNYTNHWGLAVDQAHDALVARHMLATGAFPLLGPFSSAGPFQMGGWWYWFIALATLPFQASVMTPWIVLTLLYVLFVYLIMRFGVELFGYRYGIILGLFAAVSTGEIAQSVNLTNQSPLALTSLLATWSAVRYMRTKKSWYLFELGFFVALGASTHLQGAAMIVFILATLVVSGWPTWRGLGMLILGCSLPPMTILIYDLKNNFDNIGGMLRYYFHDQYRIPLEALGRRWTTYIGVFWPVEWARIIGGNKFVAAVLAVTAFLTAGVMFLKRKLGREMTAIFVSLALIAAMIKNTRTPLFSSYLVFLHPFVLIVSAWIVEQLFRKSKIVGVVVAVVLVGLTSRVSYIEDANATNRTIRTAEKIRTKLYRKYPGKSFALFDYKYADALYSLSTSMLLVADGRSDDNGIKIGFGTPKGTVSDDWDVFSLGKDLPVAVEFGATPAGELRRDGWIWVNPSGIYTEAVNWKTSPYK
jgi:hypothetical protein